MVFGLGMEAKYDFSKKVVMKVNICEGYTQHMGHVCKQWNESIVRNMPQNPNLAKLVYIHCHGISLDDLLNQDSW